MPFARLSLMFDTVNEKSIGIALLDSYVEVSQLTSRVYQILLMYLSTHLSASVRWMDEFDLC